jgi:perosamine synthetase
MPSRSSTAPAGAGQAIFPVPGKTAGAGDSPAEPFIPLSVPNISGREWEYVKQCLDSGWVSSAGTFVDRFEREFAEAVAAKFAVSVTSGTAALHLALVLSGVQRDEEVVMPSLTFIAPANAVRYVGAWPAFIDVDPDYWQLDPAAVDRFLRRDCVRDSGKVVNRATGRTVTAILPVHLLGHPVDLDALRDLSSEFNLSLIEDATESLGAEWKGERLGSHSRLACFSFNGNKLITTGGGGMITTGDEALARRAKYLSTQAKDDPIEFVHGAVGYNYRLTNVQAAIGSAQLTRLGEFLATKRKIAQRYTAAFANLPGVTVMKEPPKGRSAFWLYTVVIRADEFGLDSRALMNTLRVAGIDSRPLWQPLHLSPAMAGSYSDACRTAQRLGRECLSLPCSTGLQPEDQDRVIDVVLRSAKGRSAQVT